MYSSELKKLFFTFTFFVFLSSFLFAILVVSMSFFVQKENSLVQFIQLHIIILYRRKFILLFQLFLQSLELLISFKMVDNRTDREYNIKGPYGLWICVMLRSIYCSSSQFGRLNLLHLFSLLFICIVYNQTHTVYKVYKNPSSLDAGKQIPED